MRYFTSSQRKSRACLFRARLTNSIQLQLLQGHWNCDREKPILNEHPDNRNGAHRLKHHPTLTSVTASLAVVTAFTTPPALAEEPLQYGSRFDTSAGILTDALYTIDDDLRGIFRYPLDNPETTGLFLLGIGALILADKPITSFYQDTIEPAVGDFHLPPIKAPDALSFLSNESRYLAAGLAGSYAFGLAFNDERAQTAAVLATKAVAYSYLTSHVILKSVLGRARPVPNLSSFSGDPGDLTTDPLDFGNFHGVSLNSAAYGTAMPSFHVTHYFAAARVYAGVYDNYLVPYGLTGVLFASNIKGHRHWVSDMLAGALIGTVIGEVVLDSYYGYMDNSVSIAPYASSDEFGLYFSKSF